MKPSNKHFVFVPGSFHGAWCWFKLQPLLSKDGNTSVAIDLPGHGKDTTPVNEVTLGSYVDAVCRVIEEYEQPVILIGHSRAGIVISQVAERMPDKIEKLVYLTAYLIPNGEPMVATAMSDTGSVLGPNLIFNDAEGWHFPKESVFKEAFYHDCSDDDLALCSSLLSKEPNLPVVTPLNLTDKSYGSVKKVYIKATEDKSISYQLQEKMISRIPMDEVFELRTSHSPFLSQPNELATILLKKL